MSLTGNTEISLHSSDNYIDLGTSFQLTCTINIGRNNSLHLHRQSGIGATCGLCDQVLADPPEYEALGRCTEDTAATYSISCAWNEDSTVMTFSVDYVTSMEFTEWRCNSPMDSIYYSSVDIVEFGR